MLTVGDWQAILMGCRDYSRMRCLLAMYLLTPHESINREILPYEMCVASKSIAEMMGVSKPAVHVLTDNLLKEGMIYKEHYGRVWLTPAGTKKAAFLKKHISVMTEIISARLGTTLMESAALAFECVDTMSLKRLGEVEVFNCERNTEKDVMTC